MGDYDLIFEQPKKKLEEITDDFYSGIFPPVKQFKRQMRMCYIYGVMEAGKTTAWANAVLWAYEYYGEENVNALRSTNFEALLQNLDEREVQILFLDDAGKETQKASQDVISAYTTLRHYYKENYDNESVVLIVFFAVQDMFLLAKKLRSTLLYLWVKTYPTNTTDQNAIKGFWKSTRMVRNNYELVDQAVKILDKITEKAYQFHDDSVKELSIGRVPSGIGIVKTIDISENDIPGKFVIFKEKSVVSGSQEDEISDVDEFKEDIPGDVFTFDKEHCLKNEVNSGVLSRVAMEFYLSNMTTAGFAKVLKARNDPEKVGARQLANYRKKAEGVISQVAGRAFEKWYAKKLIRDGEEWVVWEDKRFSAKTIGDIDRCVSGGQSVDLLRSSCELPLSLKVLDQEAKTISCYKPGDGCLPEIEYCQRNGLDSYFLVWCDLESGVVEEIQVKVSTKKIRISRDD